MLRTTRVWVGALLLTLALSPGARAGLAADQAGYVLVDKLVTLLNDTAAAKTAYADQLNRSVTGLMVQTKTAKAENRIDQEFFDRYSRVLRMFKLKIIEDKEGLLGPVADREFAAFIKDVTGKQVEGTPPIAVLSQAVTQELGNLKKLLDRK